MFGFRVTNTIFTDFKALLLNAYHETSCNQTFLTMLVCEVRNKTLKDAVWL
jgi:hypothetical protein